MMSLPVIPLAVFPLVPGIPLAMIPLPLLLFLAGCGLLTWILLKRSGRYFDRPRHRSSPAIIVSQPRPADPWSGGQRDTLARIECEQVELQERARDLSGQLNSKIIVLEQLIATSSRQIERLETLLAQSASQESGAPLVPLVPVQTEAIGPEPEKPES